MGLEKPDTCKPNFKALKSTLPRIILEAKTSLQAFLAFTFVGL
jgi:hypothetical protein